MKPPERQHTGMHNLFTQKKPPENAAVHCASPLNCHYPFSFLFNHCATARAPIKGQKNKLKYRDEAAVLMLWLSAVCLMWKVTLSYVAHFQTLQDHADWWLGSRVHEEGKKRGPGSPEGPLSCSCR